MRIVMLMLIMKVKPAWCSRQHSTAIRRTGERPVECHSQKHCSTQTAGKLCILV